MHPFLRQRIEINRQGGDEGLAFAGFHLGDHAPVQNDPAHQLNIEMALAERAFGGLAHGRKSLDEKFVEFAPLFELGAEAGGLRAQFLIRKRREARLGVVDEVDERMQAFDVAVVGGTEKPPG